MTDNTSTSPSPDLPDPERRALLATLAGTLAGGALLGCGPQEDPYRLVKPPVPGAEGWRLGEEKWLATACGQCAAGCGVRVRVVEGRAVKIAGHPANPINQGGIGPRGLSGLQVLYDPDRIRQPLRRKGPRGAGQWEHVSWDVAIDDLAARLVALRARGEPHALAAICGRDRGMVLDLFARFCQAYGTPNLLDGLSRRLGAVARATFLTQGIDEIPAYDWTSTRYVLSIGAGILEASCQAIYFTRAAAHLRQGSGGMRAKIVQVEPSQSRTAAQADEWISIAPGTHAAFVLGIAHVLVRDEAHDAAFVRDHCFGFESWRDGQGRTFKGFRELLEEYAPERASAACGVPPETIERIAHEMSTERPAFTVVDERATLGTNGLQTALAVAALNALLGAIDRPGGVLIQRPAPLGARPPVELDDVARAGLARPRLDGAGGAQHPLARSVTEALPEALSTRAPYAIDTLLLHHSNPAHAYMAPERWKAALREVPFLVSFSPFMDETAALCDLVLPDHTYLERWDDAAAAPSVGYPVWGVRQPVVEPLHDTRASGDVLLELARRLGAPLEAALPWKSVEDLVAEDIKSLHAVGRGSVVEETAKGFRKGLLQDGFWSDGPYAFERWDEVLRTPSGKFEFFSQTAWLTIEATAKAAGQDVATFVAALGLGDDPRRAAVPHQASPRWQGDQERRPFVLEPYSPGTYAEGSGANLPLLQELVTVAGQVPWQTVVEIGEDTARRLGIRAGERVEVESERGRLVGPASVRRGIRADVVRIARGGGHAELGRFARGWGANVMELLVPATDALTGVPAWHATRVSLRKVTS